jgi:hypothetical protein
LARLKLNDPRRKALRVHIRAEEADLEATVGYATLPSWGQSGARVHWQVARWLHDNQLVTKSDLCASVAELRAELNDLKACMLTRLIAMFGIALGIIALMIRFLSPAGGIQ